MLTGGALTVGRDAGYVPLTGLPPGAGFVAFSLPAGAGSTAVVLPLRGLPIAVGPLPPRHDESARLKQGA